MPSVSLALHAQDRPNIIYIMTDQQGAGAMSCAGNPDLQRILNQYFAADPDGNWLNDGHHEYMGRHVDEMEELLRESFPGRDEEFYEYGKWGGGAFNSKAFDNLNKEDQNRIYSYLRELGILF